MLIGYVRRVQIRRTFYLNPDLPANLASQREKAGLRQKKFGQSICFCRIASSVRQIAAFALSARFAFMAEIRGQNLSSLA